MTYANEILAGPVIRLPHVPIPKLRWPRLSQRARSLLMMGLMISPVFLCDAVGYCIERLFHTAGEIAAMRMQDAPTFAHVDVFHVACGDAAGPAERQRWSDFAARHGWPMYPQAGETCFRPDQVLLGFVGLKTFNVACPTLVLSVAD